MAYAGAVVAKFLAANLCDDPTRLGDDQVARREVPLSVMLK